MKKYIYKTVSTSQNKEKKFIVCSESSMRKNIEREKSSFAAFSKMTNAYFIEKEVDNSGMLTYRGYYADKNGDLHLVFTKTKQGNPDSSVYTKKVTLQEFIYFKYKGFDDIKIKIIYTHPGQHHADEVTAVAFLMLIELCDTDVKIKRVNNEEIPFVLRSDEIVLDTGRRYEPHNGFFDHHQDPFLEATNCLIMDAFKNFLPEGYYEPLYRRLFDRISQIDRGIITGGMPCEYNGIIRIMPNFEKALSISRTILSAMFANIGKLLEDAVRWNNLETIKIKDVKFKVEKSSNYLQGWNELAKTDGIMGFITPNVRGGFQVISRDSKEWSIIPTKRQSFRHNTGFMAVYSSMEDLLNDLYDFEELGFFEDIK